MGSIWRRWDLHVHTPCSVVNGYGGNNEVAWERFLTELEALPPEFAVIGVNDYLFLDGYKRLRAEKENGRLGNIETLLPVVEFRLAKFAGRDDRWLRVNFHVVFSEDLEPDVIESQFLAGLATKLTISAEYARAGSEWVATITPQSLIDLGKLIRSTIPVDRRHEFTEDDFTLGFNNVNFDEGELRRLLDNSYLRGKSLTALGKTEWDQYHWNDNSIAEKKNVINAADMVFTAAADVAAFQRAKGKLVSENVKSILFDCSDAHQFTDSLDKDRIGNCLTWVKGDPTFAGLAMALRTYDERVFVGIRPPVLEDADRHPGKYISRLQIAPVGAPRAGELWFDNVELDLNPELVAVIGNRGMGKSALLDVLALAGNSERPIADLTFLKRFQPTRANLAESFEATLTWRSGELSPVRLNRCHNPEAPSRVKHLPQQFIEVVCNNDDDQFEMEIQRVVFSHVPEVERLGSANLAELIEFRSAQITQKLEAAKSELTIANGHIADLEAALAPDAVARLRTELESGLKDIQSLCATRPRLTAKPSSADPAIEVLAVQLRTEVAAIQEAKRVAELNLAESRTALESTRRITALVDKMAADTRKYAVEYAQDFERASLNFADIIGINLRRELVVERETALTAQVAEIRESLDASNDKSVAARLIAKQAELKTAEAELSGPLQVHQANLVRYREFRAALADLAGSQSEPTSLRGLRSRLRYLQGEAPRELKRLAIARNAITKRIFDLKVEEASLFVDLYKPVQDFADANPPQDSTFHLGFKATLEQSALVSGLFALVANNRAGTFYGSENASRKLEQLVCDVSFEEWATVAALLDSLVAALHTDQRPSHEGVARQPSEQLRPGVTVQALYDYLFGLEFIAVRHRLTMGGRPLHHLSPGEKGALLLVFYLLVDQSDCPLLVDQPEENLDNQSVYGILVPFIREARKRRQVILVTHNPNIAVVAGAEQIIYCEMDKANGSRLSYEAGALENPTMNVHVVDVLEGTRPAFTDREEKYRVSAAK